MYFGLLFVLAYAITPTHTTPPHNLLSRRGAAVSGANIHFGFFLKCKLKFFKASYVIYYVLYFPQTKNRKQTRQKVWAVAP